MQSSISAASRPSTARQGWPCTAFAVLLALAVGGAAPAGFVFSGARAETGNASPVQQAAQALERARQLHAQQRSNAALAAIEEGLEAVPHDAQLRFQRGVILAAAGRTDQAIETFSALTREFPELPEPHNNLAALHASRGELDLARSALEQALRALPSYALAHENLGDVQLRLAERSYRRAVEADATNAAARGKLASVVELLGRIAPGAAPSAGSPSGSSAPPSTSTPRE